MVWYGHFPNYLIIASGVIALSALLGSGALARSAYLSADDSEGLERLSEFAVFVCFLAFYAVTAGNDASPFNAHIRQAFAFIHGHVDVDAPNYIEHAVFQGRSYQLHPPLPAFILMPIVAIFGMDTNQTMISIIVGALDVAFAWRMLRRFRITTNARMWLTVFFGVGTIVWFETVSGTSWAVAMLFAIGFTMPALDEVLGPARPLRVGIWAGLAALARNDLVLVWPMYAALTYLKRRELRELTWMIPGFAFTMLVYTGFNWVRYHSIFDHTEFIFVESFAKGTRVFGLQYLPGNINTILFMAPALNDTFPYFHPVFGGQSLLLTSPAFLLALRPSFRRLEVVLVGLSVLAAMTPSLLYFANGYAQFGTRHYLHAFPFLLVLMAMGMHRRADQMARILIVASVFLIAFGVWHVRMYGFAS